MGASKADGFAALVNRASTDDRVAALVLGGGRGKGLVTIHSDFDVYLMLFDGIGDEIPDYESQDSNIEVFQMPVGRFRTYADFDSDEEWNRYNFAHLTAVIDKTGGGVQGRLDQMEMIPDTIALAKASASLDAFVNYAYRATKSVRHGDFMAAQLDSLEAWPWLLNFIFNSERRVRPYNKFLAWELRAHPLESPVWQQESLLALIRRVENPGESGALGEALTRIEQTSTDHNPRRVLDAWDPEALAAIRNLSLL